MIFHPPSVGLETGKESDGGGRFLILSSNYLRVYNIRAVTRAPYKTIQPQIAHLEELLKQSRGKPRNAGKSVPILPDYPPRNAGHLIESKLSYLEAPWGSGICYITQFVQGMGETPNNQQLVYIFQGVSKGKQLFISADFQIRHPDVPAGPEDPSFDWRKPEEKDAAEAFCKKIERTLNSAPDESFTPSLRSIREWLLQLKVDG